MKKLLLITFLAFGMASCQKDDSTTPTKTATPTVNLLSFGTSYIGARNQFYMNMSMTNIENVSKLELMTSGSLYPIPLKAEKQIVWIHTLADTKSLMFSWKFTMKTGAAIYTEPRLIQY